jgi:hypothetical protein
MLWRSWLPDHPPNFIRSVVVGSAAALLGTALRLALQPALADDLPFITYFPVLSATAVWGGMGAGLLCLVLSCAASVIWFLPRADLLHLTWSVLAFLLSGGRVPASSAPPTAASKHVSSLRTKKP